MNAEPIAVGLEWDLRKTPVFNTKIMQSVNGRELRASYQAVPKYEISMSFAFLRESKGRQELQLLESFFLERRGSFDSFLFKMPEDHEFECTFIGDGVTLTFQLYKQAYNLKIPIAHTESLGKVLMWNRDQNLMWSSNDQTLMWSNDLYQVTSDGRVIFIRPLAIGELITISGTFYYRCRFKDDAQEYTHFMAKLWKASKVEMIGSLGNKI
ncbi:DUF2460 domain-containing protein [Acinetobacter ursingii]|uniref:DUF2460 domain-containing protein n=1 Tax=Acinetobacter ursingii TaxID=108980 RepID=UPI003AF5C760